MIAGRKLIKNTLSMLVAWVFEPVMGLFLVMVIGRTLGPEIFGKYTIIFQLYLIFQITSSFGLRLLLTREVAAKKDQVNKFLVNGTLLSLPAVALNIVVMVLLIKLLKYEPDVTLGSYIISVSLIASALTEVFSGILAGYEEFQKIAIGWIIFLVLKTALSICALIMGYGLIALIVVHLVTKFLHTAINYFFITKCIVRPKIEIDFAICKKLFGMMWSLSLLIICTSIFWRIDVIILSKIVPNEVVGIYGAAQKIFKFILLSVRSFFMAFFPMLSSMFVNRRREFQKACRKAIRYLTILVLPLALIVTSASPHLMPLLWGNKFSDATIVMQVLIWSLFPFVITEVFSQAFVASNNQNINLIFNTIILIVKLVLTYFLSVKYGAVGPAIATIIGLIILAIIQFPFVVPKLIKFKPPALVAPFIKIVIASFFMIITIYFLNQYHFAIGIPIAGIIYFMLLFLLKMFSDEDKRYFMRMVKKTA